MNSLTELIEYCREHQHWVTMNYSPYDKTYQVFVNPGRAMASARRHKTLEDAVRACWVALGVTTMPKNIQKFHEKADEVFKDSPPSAVVSATVPIAEMAKMFEQVSISGKRRGRPKGSKNKPKAEKLV